jgi:transcriptional regulator GlxA family with amidase domain
LSGHEQGWHQVWKDPPQEDELDSRIRWAIDHLERAMATSVSVAELAAAVNLSPSRFWHLFREQTGTSPLRYLHRLRMQRAHALIERSFLSIKQVMAHVGINDPSHFARDFKRLYGVAPTELRRLERSRHTAGARPQDALTNSANGPAPIPDSGTEGGSRKKP